MEGLGDGPNNDKNNVGNPGPFLLKVPNLLKALLVEREKQFLLADHFLFLLGVVSLLTLAACIQVIIACGSQGIRRLHSMKARDKYWKGWLQFR